MPFDATPLTNPMIETLEKMYELIKEPEHWCKGVEARTYLGFAISPDNKLAHSFCLIGAYRRVTGGVSFELSHCLRLEGVALFNDDPTTTHQDVLNRIKDAIDRERAKLLVGRK